MRRLWLRVVLLTLILLILGVLGTLVLSPKVTSFTPEKGSQVPAAVPIELSFSQSMQTSSVEDKLIIEPSIPGQYTWNQDKLIFTPDQLWPAGTSIQITLPAGVRSSNWPGLPTLQNFSTTFTIAEPQVAYLYPANGVADLYVLGPEGDLPEKLTSIQGGISSYSSTRDGRQIYLATNGGEIYRLERFTGVVTLVDSCTAAACSDPNVSPDGRYLAYVRVSENQAGPRALPQVWLQPLPDGDAQPVDSSALSTQSPHWSSNGWLAYYDEIAQLYQLFNPVTGEKHGFSNQTGEAGDWSVDGRSFIAPEIFLIPNAYVDSTGNLEPMPTSHLLQMNIDSRQAIDLTQEDVLEDSNPAVSPSGNMIAFSRKYLDPARWTPGRQLWLMNADGTQRNQLTNSPFHNHYSMDWKPDGKQLVFVRSNQTSLSEPVEIWQINVDGSSATRLIIGGFAPRWIP